MPIAVITSPGSTLQRLLADLTAGRVDAIVVHKIDRLARSLADFAKIVEILDTRGASFVSVTQQFNTTTSMGVRRERRRFPVGARPTRRFAPAGSNRSRHGGDEMSEAFG